MDGYLKDDYELGYNIGQTVTYHMNFLVIYLSRLAVMSEECHNKRVFESITEMLDIVMDAAGKLGMNTERMQRDIENSKT